MPHHHHPLPRLFAAEADRRRPAYRLLRGMLAESGTHPALPLVMLLVAADGECRNGRLAAAALLLSLATNHPALQEAGAEGAPAVAALAVARQDAALEDRAHCAAAIATAIFALLRDHTSH